MKKPLRLFSCFWGEKHLDLFERALVKSLSWPQNRAAIFHATWDVWTRQEDFASVVDIAKAVGIKIELQEADQFLADRDTKYLKDSGVMMNQMFTHSIRRCIDTGSQMLIAPPDTIFGGDSIANILQEGEHPGTVVFVPHIRVLPTIFDLLNGQYLAESIGNERLALLALKCAHKSFTEAEYGHERINTFIGGILWKKRPNGLIRMQHMLPTPYLINWTEDDFKFFTKEPSPGQWPQVFGMIDHTWPSHCVHGSGRARTIMSGDDAFIVEITEDADNIPPLMNYDASEPDRFWRNAPHNLVNKQFCYTFRGE